MERRVRSRSKQIRQMAVLHEVLDVSHLVVDRLKIFRVHLRAHLDPTVQSPATTLFIIEVLRSS